MKNYTLTITKVIAFKQQYTITTNDDLSEDQLKSIGQRMNGECNEHSMAVDTSVTMAHYQEAPNEDDWPVIPLNANVLSDGIRISDNETHTWLDTIIKDEGISNEPQREPVRFNHAYTLAFEVGDSKDFEGDDVTDEMMARSLISKIMDLKAKGILAKTVGSAFDTVRTDPDRKFEARTVKPKSDGLILEMAIDPSDTLEDVKDELFGLIHKRFREPLCVSIDGLDEDFVIDAAYSFFEGQKDFETNGRWIQPGEQYHTLYFVI